MSLAPIVLFVYSRLWHTEQALTSLSKNELANNFIQSHFKNEDIHYSQFIKRYCAYLTLKPFEYLQKKEQ